MVTTFIKFTILCFSLFSLQACDSNANGQPSSVSMLLDGREISGMYDSYVTISGSEERGFDFVIGWKIRGTEVIQSLFFNTPSLAVGEYLLESGNLDGNIYTSFAADYYYDNALGRYDTRYREGMFRIVEYDQETGMIVAEFEGAYDVRSERAPGSIWPESFTISDGKVSAYLYNP